VKAVHDRLDNLEHRERGNAVADKRPEDTPALQLREPAVQGHRFAWDSSSCPARCRGLIGEVFVQLRLGFRGHATPLASFSFKLRKLPEAGIIAQRAPGRIDAQERRGKRGRTVEKLANVPDRGIDIAHARFHPRSLD